MENLPMEITDDILCRLPIERALPAKQVCKTFRNLLRSKTDKVGLLFAERIFKEERNILYYGDEYDPISGKMNYNYSCYDNRLDKMLKGKFVLGCRYTYTDYMLGSCNGLVCIERANMEKPFLICNPITGQVVYAPRTNKSVTRYYYPCGFGYCHSTNEYKIVRMHYEGLKRSHVLVYTIGGVVGWRSKGSILVSPSDIGAYIASNSAAGVYANGALHWLYRKNNIRDYAIMAFDLEDEKFEFIDLSLFKNLRYDRGPKLLGGNNNLYLVFSTIYNQPYFTDIWAYKREIANTTNACELKANYTDKNSWHWIKEFSVKWEEPPLWKDMRFAEPLAVTRNNEFLLRYGCRAIYCYDLKTSTLHKLFDGPATGCSLINVIPHANSIVSMPLKAEQVQHHQ